MKKTGTFFLSIILATSLAACNEESTMYGDVFDYKDSYVGDNSSVVAIVKTMPGNESVDQIALETNEKPYGIEISYKEEDTFLDEHKRGEIMVSNATYLYTLVKNVEIITFVFPEKEYQLSRQEVEEWYGQELSEVETEDQLQTLMEEKLENENAISELIPQ
ncbi:DUF4825 domain-containing protein [Paenisporosarcina cavernae]|uniref:DUF4825 domain-containing protein n=1 Tax=Paenisporosarcina cavernae TaxID=2320858 RepID=A0A385YP37_9BACL|nr:DUF4825 domain-containing protein [Paenisporosarcina cavernae]AYC28435.1 DUF4825 domain-containing protein [Paenisporosarcina cavernae]